MGSGVAILGLAVGGRRSASRANSRRRPSSGAKPTSPSSTQSPSIPAAFPSILTGLKIRWAFAWRTLIAAELVFGVSSGKGGLGWYIYENKNMLEIPAVFARLFTVILIGLLVENLLFRNVEKDTVRRWGMQS